MRTVAVNPSDFPYLFDECPRCYWRKANGFQRVSKPGGNYAIGNAFDSAAKAIVKEGRGEEFGIPYPIVSQAEKEWVCSEPIPYPDLDLQLVVRGKTDARFITDRDTVVLVDFKAGASEIRKFFDQLMLYCLALTKPEKGAGEVIEAIGIVQWNMREAKLNLRGAPLHGQISGPVVWGELEMDWVRVYDLLERVAKVASSVAPPESGGFCEFCFSVEAGARFDYEAKMRELNREVPA